MPNTTFKDIQLKVGNSGAMVDITAYVNQNNLKRTLSMIEQSAYADSNRTFIPGLAGTTLQINGWVNSTTDAIFGPLVVNQSSVAKSFQYKTNAGTKKYYNGSCFFTDIQYSGNLNNMQTFSVSLQITGGVNNTSVSIS